MNEEDDCKGRFWEGRFKSQALLDEAALLSAMVYVDLNPIRAGITSTPEASEFTSIYERIQFISKQLNLSKQTSIKCTKMETAEIFDKLPQPKGLVPFATIVENQSHAIDSKLSDYIELIDYTGRTIREDKQAGSIAEHLHPILTCLQFRPEHWVSFVKSLDTTFSHAVGSEILLINFAKKAKRKGSLKGISQANKFYAPQTQAV